MSKEKAALIEAARKMAAIIKAAKETKEKTTKEAEVVEEAAKD